MTYLTETFIPYTKVLTPLLLEGLWITIYVSALAFLLSIILGAILAIIQHFRVKILSQLAKVYVSYFRGTPLLIQLFLFYYGLPMVFDIMKSETTSSRMMMPPLMYVTEFRSPASWRARTLFSCTLETLRRVLISETTFSKPSMSATVTL